MKFISLYLILFILNSAVLAQVPPSKSLPCLTAIHQFVLSDFLGRQENSRFVINSLSALKKNEMGYKEDIGTGYEDGFFNSNRVSRGLNLKQAAQRIEGIKYFFGKSEGENPSKEYFTRTFTVSGKENILAFLDDYEKLLSRNQKEHWVGKSFEHTANILLSLEFFERNWQFFFPEISVYLQNPALAAAMGGLTLLWTDFWMRFLFNRDFKIKKDINLLRESLYEKRSWAIISRSQELNEQHIQILIDGKIKDDEIIDQVLLEEINRDRRTIVVNKFRHWLIEHVNKEKLKREWVGIDYILDNTQSEPDLFLIIRGSKKRPPQTSPSKEKSNDDKKTDSSGFNGNEVPL